MKRFVLYFFLLVSSIAVLAIAVDYVNVRLIRASTGNSAYKMERLYSNPEPDEIAIIGSSRALGNFVPSIISPRCFDYGVSAMRMREITFLLEVLQKRETQAPVIVNLDPWGAFGSTTFVADYRLAPQSGRLAVSDCIPGVRFFGTLRKNLVSMMNAKKSVTSVVDRGANLLKESRSTEEWAVINSKLTAQGFSGDIQAERRLQDVLQSFSPRKVYLVVGPCSSAWMDKFTGRAALEAFLGRVDAPNVTVLNFFGSSDFSDADFTDPTHFNLEGARRFSELLKSRLASLESR